MDNHPRQDDSGAPPPDLEDLLRAHRQPFSPPPALALRQFLRSNLLILVSALVFLGAVGLVVFQIDRTYYIRAKADLIRDVIDEEMLESEVVTALDRLIDDYVTNYLRGTEISAFARTAEGRHKERMNQQAHLLLQAYPYVWRVEFTAGDTSIFAVEDLQRRRTQNTFRNSLLVRDFVQTWTKVKTVDGRRAGRFQVHLTTPRDNPRIEALTRVWRMRSAAVVLVMTAFFGLLLWFALLPVRKVTAALDKGARAEAPLIPRPRIVMEKYYNNLARDANLSILSTALREYISRYQVTEHAPLLNLAPRLIRQIFHVNHVDVVAWHLSEDGKAMRREQARVPGGPGEDFLNVLDEAASSGQRMVAIEVFHPESAPEFHWLIREVSRDDHRVTCLVFRLASVPGNLAAWWTELLDQVAREVQFALGTISEQRRLILQEKNKANITLSRNIGHDLTNIIATGKLDLVNLKVLLSLDREQLRSNPGKEDLLHESLEALLNNSRFLQETVNLYRSFSYLSRPKFEEVMVNDLVTEVCEIFRLSSSRSIDVIEQPSPDVPSIVLEARLIRLALFNMLTNAADAIKRASLAQSRRGVITVSTLLDERARHVILRVEDNGDGIRDLDGKLLDAREVNAIFKLGYSTKDQGTGEGLGLNWVQQIVEDFHGGVIVAANRPEGGARFEIHLPLQSVRVE